MSFEFTRMASILIESQVRITWLLRFRSQVLDCSMSRAGCSVFLRDVLGRIPSALCQTGFTREVAVTITICETMCRIKV